MTKDKFERRLLNVFVLMAFLVATAHGSTPEELTADNIIERYLETQGVDSELAFIDVETRSLTDESGDSVKRHRLLALTQKQASGNYSFLVRIMRPFDVEGLSVLSVEEDNKEMAQYLYLPAVGEVTRLAGDSMQGSFLGTDFSYEDLLREVPSRFHYERLADKEIKGETYFVVRARPKEEGEATGYLFRDLYLSPENYSLNRVEFYDDEEEKFKVLRALGYKSKDVKGDTVRPRFAIMTDIKKGSKTTFKVIESRVNLSIEPVLFTPEKMAAWTSEEVRELVFGYGFTVTTEKPDLM